jgi:zinc protease
VPDASRVQAEVTLAETLGLTRTDADYYAVELGNAVLGGGFYSSRLSVDLRKNSGLVYSVGSNLEAGKSRSVYFVQYACDPDNIVKAQDMITRELEKMRSGLVPADELRRAKALLIRQMPLSEASIGEIAQALIGRIDRGLPLDEPSDAARRFIMLEPADVRAAFEKWIRPDGLVRVSQGPGPG